MAKMVKRRRKKKPGFVLRVVCITPEWKGFYKSIRLPFAPTPGMAISVGTFEDAWVTHTIKDLTFDPVAGFFHSVAMIHEDDPEMYLSLGFKADPGVFIDGPRRHLRLVKPA